MGNILSEELDKRNITRLCHFTKSKNLGHIFNDFDGILATAKIPTPYKDINDDSRFDGKPDYVCCSVQYPNLYYLERIINNDLLFRDWTILCIDPKIILKKDLLFSKVNAATEGGKHIKSGERSFLELFSDKVSTRNSERVRQKTQPSCCPTDFQAEVLIKEKIPKSYIKGVIVKNEKQALEEQVRLELLNIKQDISIIISPELFSKDVFKKISSGILPSEIIYRK